MAVELGQDIVGFQPNSDEILSALILFSGRVPQDEALLAQGLVVACESAPFLSRFINPEGGLTEDARGAITKLGKSVLVCADGVFTIDPLKKPGISLGTEMFFKQKGLDALQTAAQAAQEVWSKGLDALQAAAIAAQEV